MIEAVMFWNEPNNKSHWDFEIDPGLALFAEMARLAARGGRGRAARPARACSAASRRSIRSSSATCRRRACSSTSTRSRCTASRSTGTTGRSTSGPTSSPRSARVTRLPVWVSEVGVSTFGAEEVQELGLRRTAELLRGRAPRIHWYSLYDLPRAWPATTRHARRKDPPTTGISTWGCCARTARRSSRRSASRDYTPGAGHLPVVPFRGSSAGRRRALAASELGVRYLRTGLSWADSFRPDALDWFDRQMEALETFDVTRDFLLHAGAPRHRAAPHQPAARCRGVRRVLRAAWSALRAGQRDRAGRQRARLA